MAAGVVPPAGAYRFIDYATQGYIALVGLLVLFFHGPRVPLWAPLAGAHAFGLVMIHGLIRLHARHPGNRWLDLLRHFYPVLLYTGFYCETGVLNQMFVSHYFDPFFIRLEGQLFGMQPSLAFMERLPYLAVSELFYVSYFSYYIMIVGVGLALYVQDRRRFFHYVSIVSFVFYICYLIYIFLPVIGPRVLFHDFPGYAGTPQMLPWPVATAFPEAVTRGPFYQIMKFIYAHFGSTGAAFPSSHVAIAACTLYFSIIYLPRVRVVHGIFVVLLCLSTIYCRYHYAVDVLAGLLTVAVLLPIGNRLYRASGSAGALGKAPGL